MVKENVLGQDFGNYIQPKMIDGDGMKLISFTNDQIEMNGEEKEKEIDNLKHIWNWDKTRYSFII